MEAIFIQVLNGLDKGAAYALIALGLTLAFGTLGVVNFAHGALFMLGAFCAVAVNKVLTISDKIKDESITFFEAYKEVPYLEIWWGDTGKAIIDWSIPISILIAIPIMALIGIAMERGLIRFFYKRTHAEQILVTFGLAIVLQEIVKLFFGANPIPQAAPDIISGSAPIGSWFGWGDGLGYPWWRLMYFLFSTVVIGGVFAFLQYTTYGMVVRAGMADRETVGLLGINISRRFHRVRPGGGGRRFGGRYVHADRGPGLSHGHEFPGAVVRGGRRGRHGFATWRRRGGLPAGHFGIVFVHERREAGHSGD